MKYIGAIYSVDNLRNVNWSRQHWFYTLFTCVAHAVHPIVNLDDVPRPSLSCERDIRHWRSGLDEISALYDRFTERNGEDVPAYFARFINYAQRRTTDTEARKERARFGLGSNREMTQAALVQFQSHVDSCYDRAKEVLGHLPPASSTTQSVDYETDARTEGIFFREFTRYERSSERLFLHYASGGTSIGCSRANSYLNTLSESHVRKLTRAGWRILVVVESREHTGCCQALSGRWLADMRYDELSQPVSC